MRKKSQIILEKTYTAEEIVDVDDDIHWALNESDIPLDDTGFHEGNFEVVITWTPDKEIESDDLDDLDEEYEDEDEYLGDFED